MTTSDYPPFALQEEGFQKIYQQPYEQSVDLDIDLLLKLNNPLPRYTSYPTAPEWVAMPQLSYKDKIQELDKRAQDLSLYFHIPFCRNMCLFCGCSVTLNRNTKIQDKYVDHLIKEIDLVTKLLKKEHTVRQLHFGGGTPTQLTEEQFKRLFDHIAQSFSIDFTSEVAIEIDPRTVTADNGKKLKFLKDLGFNRVSFGVQDTNSQVQEAVRRRQSYEQSRDTLYMARDMGFKSINLDLIYGLPHQTVESFDETTDKILEMRPSRIAMYSFARTPWLKPHQKAIKEESLPPTEEKFRIYTSARKKLIEAGYLAIGMDHFVLRNDDMAHSFFQKKLQRNFQGYSIKYAEHLIGFGVTSTGFVENAYFQNVKSLDEYYECTSQNILPVSKGKILNHDDILRQWVISSLMCEFEVRKDEFLKRFHKSFDDTFSEELLTLQNPDFTELVTNKEKKLSPTPQGKLFIRNIAAVFDAYLKEPSNNQRFSNAV